MPRGFDSNRLLMGTSPPGSRPWASAPGYKKEYPPKNSHFGGGRSCAADGMSALYKTATITANRASTARRHWLRECDDIMSPPNFNNLKFTPLLRPVIH